MTSDQPWAADWTAADRRGLDPTRARRVLAPNPSPLTLDGTNTWILAEPGSERCIVVDPGPADDNHQQALDAALRALDLRPALVLLTHGHIDHAESATTFADDAGIAVRAVDRRHCHRAVPLTDSETIEVDGLVVEVIATPGHTADSASFFLPGEGSVVTGDTILGRGTSLVAHPDGNLGDYLSSVQRIRTIAAAGLALLLLPGHGPVVPKPLRAIDALLEHREDRLAQLRLALEEGAESVSQVADAVYGAPGPGLHDAVIAQVRAQLEYLASVGSGRAAAAARRE